MARFRAHFSTSLSGNAERLKALSSSVNRNIASGIDSLSQFYGGRERCESMWASEYYRHREHKYLVPALKLSVGSAESACSPALVSKNAVFYASVLRGLGETDFMSYVSTLPMVEGVPLGTLLDVLRGVDTVQGKIVFDRLVASAGRSGSKEVESLIAHSKCVPQSRAPEWPFPHLDPSLSLENAELWKPEEGESPRVFEVTGLAPRLRELCDGPTWLFLSATTVLESQWAHFYATGDAQPLDRILEATLPWVSTKAVNLPDSPSFIVDIEKPLPEQFTLKKGLSPEQALTCIQANVARAALWSLLMHSRRHPAVTRAVAAACGSIAPYVAEPSARGNEGSFPTLSEEDVLARVETWPPLLHLISRGRMDAAFREGKE